MDNYDLRNLIARTHAGAIIPALMHRIPSELRIMPKLDNYDLRILIARTHVGAIIPALMHRIPSELRRNLIAHTHAGAIITALMHRIPSELCSEACLGESSTRMGDLLGSPRVAPLFFTGVSINGLEILKMAFWGGTDRRRVSQRIEWKILPRMHILYVEF
ncbi:hypothetical protein Lal_00008492 [Lupinus albus]|nr:hypothetical protein Lal_00008492 [Lupinus albus]